MTGNLKTCSKCKQEKSLDWFGKSSKYKSGLRSECKECRKAEQKEYYSDNKEKVIKRTTEYAKKNPEIGRKSVRNYIERHPDKVRLSAINQHHRNKGVRNQKSREWRKANPEKVRAYGAKHGAKTSKTWRSKNKDAVNYQAMQRYCSKLQATPPWVDKEHKASIKEIYTASKALKKAKGIDFEVDHIEPLKGKNSCGLNVWWNLRVVPAKENRQKYNKLLT